VLVTLTSLAQMGWSGPRVRLATGADRPKGLIEVAADDVADGAADGDM